jgi:hypothetical protein
MSLETWVTVAISIINTLLAHLPAKDRSKAKSRLAQSLASQENVKQSSQSVLEARVRRQQGD